MHNFLKKSYFTEKLVQTGSYGFDYSEKVDFKKTRHWTFLLKVSFDEKPLRSK